MVSIFAQFKQAQAAGSGDGLAATLRPEATPQDPNRMRSFYSFTNSANVDSDIRYALLQDRATGVKLPRDEGNAWVELFVAFWKASREVVALEEMSQSQRQRQQHRGAGVVGTSTWTGLFYAWREVANLLIRGYTNGGFPAWTLPCLYVVGKYLRIFAMEADAENVRNPAAFNASYNDDVISDVNPREKLEESSWVLNRMYTTCLHDRSPIEESRRWGVYATVNLSLKTYFKLGSVGSCKSLLHAMEASQTELPPLSAFPKSHVVTFKYYLGVICFLDEHYSEAEEHLSYAWKLCHRDARKNRELILTYLIPCHFVTSHTLPSATLLEPYPRLARLFGPLARCIRRGDLAGFDRAMVAGEAELVRKRIYLPLERARDIAVRNVFRKVFLAGGFDPASVNVNGVANQGQGEGQGQPLRRTRVPISEFVAAMRLSMRHDDNDDNNNDNSGQEGGNEESGAEADNEREKNKDKDKEQVDRDEVECFLANLIYKNLVKGYIARERAMVVLSKAGAFPGTGV